MRTLSVVGSVVASLLVSVSPAQSLKVGDKAPPLQIGEWVKGEPVSSFVEGRAYVVEFWATWCGPCIASMPHLSALQREHAEGLTIIGVTSRDPNNSLEQVKAMVEDKGDGMAYTVAWDDARKTNEAYMRAAGQNGIPCSFLIGGDGNIAYIGHPILLDIPLPDVLAGKWDAVEGSKRVRAAEATLNKVFRTAGTDPAAAEAVIAEALAEFPMLEPVVADVRWSALLRAGKTEQAYEIASGLVDAAIAGKDAQKLNSIAWAIVDPQTEVAERNLDLALRAAQKAVEFTHEKDGAILDTLARVWFWKEDVAKAIEIQRKAVAVSDRDDVKAALEEYEKAAKKDGEPR